MIRLSEAMKATCNYLDKDYLGINVLSEPRLLKKLKHSNYLVTLYFTNTHRQNNVDTVSDLKHDLDRAKRQHQSFLVDVITDFINSIQKDNQLLRSQPRYHAYLVRGTFKTRKNNNANLINEALRLATPTEPVETILAMLRRKYRNIRNHHKNVVGKIVGNGRAIYNLFCSGFMTDEDISHDIKLSKRNTDRLLHPHEAYASKSSSIVDAQTYIKLYNIKDDVQEYFDDHLDKFKHILKAPDINGTPESPNVSPITNPDTRDYMKWGRLYFKFLGVPSLFPNGFKHLKYSHRSWQTYPLRPQIQFIGQSHVKPRSLVFGRYKPKVVVSTLDYLQWKANYINPERKALNTKYHKYTKGQLIRKLINKEMALRSLMPSYVVLGLEYLNKGYYLPKQVKIKIKDYIRKHGKPSGNPFTK